MTFSFFGKPGTVLYKLNSVIFWDFTVDNRLKICLDENKALTL